MKILRGKRTMQLHIKIPGRNGKSDLSDSKYTKKGGNVTAYERKKSNTLVEKLENVAKFAMGVMPMDYFGIAIETGLRKLKR